MARMRAVKQQLKDLLSAPDWRDHLPELRSMGQPAVGPLFSFLLLGEVMSPQMILGACLIFSSILYIEYKPGRKKKDKQQDIC